MKKFLKFKFIRAIILLVLDGLFFGLVNPNTTNSVFLIVAFVLLGFTFYIIVDALLYLLQSIGINLKKRHKAAAFISVSITLLLVLQSLGQLTIKDSVVILIFALIAYFYSSRLRSQT